MPKLSAEETVQAVDHTIHEVGSVWMVHEETVTRAAEFGYGKLAPFYFAGRGGVLGDVDADVVFAAMGYWNPVLLRKMWDRGVAVRGAREAAQRYARACAEWGADHLGGLGGTARFNELAERLVTTVEGSGLPLFAGWRAVPLADYGPSRLLQLVHVLREWRGAMHLVATTAEGLGPLEAILTNEGEDRARMFGWRDEFPDVGHLKERHARAQATTDRLAASGYEKALTADERGEFADLVAEVGAVVLGPVRA